MKIFSKYCCVVISFFVYSLTGIFTKFASTYPMFSIGYIVFFAVSLLMIGIFALLWQQILKNIPICDAYMFKGTTLIWSMLFCYFIFEELITITNVIGSIIIVCGITLYSLSDKYLKIV